MRNSILLFFLFGALANVNAQIFESDWEHAIERAKEESKPLVLVFSGSDWCIPCIKLEREVWENDFFKAHAMKNYVLYKADFPKRKKNQLPQNLKVQHQALAEEYNPQGYFPYVVVLDASLNVNGVFGYEKKEVEHYIKQIDGR